LNVPNSTAQYPTVTVVSQYGGGQTETGKVFVPSGTEAFGHDADGNLTSDGRWTYSWDGENRLVQMIRDSDSPTGARQKLVFEYDHQGRRIRKQFFTYNGGWQEQTDTIFVYDNWNLVAELNANSSNARVRTYVWGTDLSGSMQGAGGVGGLLKLTYYGTATTNAFVAYGGNGNVTALVDAGNGSMCARYEYGPFAEPIRSSGPLSKLNPIRFSTKYTDNESGVLYYGYRYYNPSTGRWPNRDPGGESAFLMRWFPRHLRDNGHRVRMVQHSDYTFNGNDGLGRFEPLGLWPWSRFEEHSNPDGSTTITVLKKCTIVILFGHGSSAAPHRFAFKDSCTAGAFVGCDAGSTNRRIPVEHSVPGTKLTDGDLYSGIPAQNRDEDERFSYWMQETKTGARLLATWFCIAGKCCCKEVVIYGELAGSAWAISNWGFPSEWKEVVGCSEVK